MKLILLKNNFDVETIKIDTDEIFQHLKDFLFEDSKDYISAKLCSIYALEIENYIRWFISFSASMIKIKEKHFWFLGRNSKDLEQVWFPIPGMLIWKLLIDNDLRWNGYGGKLMEFAISTAYELSKTIGIRFIIVDANNNAVWFYQKYGFIPIEPKEKTTTMLFDLKEFDDL